jgi:hypothetical protein
MSRDGAWNDEPSAALIGSAVFSHAPTPVHPSAAESPAVLGLSFFMRSHTGTNNGGMFALV